MPVPVLVANPESGAAALPTNQPSQKSMTKAERRELQEKQRAAKLLLKQQGPGGGAPAAPAANKAKAAPKVAASPVQKKFPGADTGSAKVHSQARDAGGAAQSTSQGNRGAVAEDGGVRSGSRGLQIFSHFGLPKTSGHTLKGDIHPAIVRLALLFSEFRICGANARCIATLTAFKMVSFCIPSVVTRS